MIWGKTLKRDLVRSLRDKHNSNSILNNKCRTVQIYLLKDIMKKRKRLQIICLIHPSKILIKKTQTLSLRLPTFLQKLIPSFRELLNMKSMKTIKLMRLRKTKMKIYLPFHRNTVNLLSRRLYPQMKPKSSGFKNKMKNTRKRKLKERKRLFPR